MVKGKRWNSQMNEKWVSISHLKKSASESLTCIKVMIAPQSPSIPRNSDGWKSRTMWAAATCKFWFKKCDDFESQDLLKRDKMRIPGRLQQGQQIANPTCPQAISLPLLWAELLAGFVVALSFLFFSNCVLVFLLLWFDLPVVTPPLPSLSKNTLINWIGVYLTPWDW